MEEKITTKNKIIWEALRLFSERGYEGVSIREIAAAVGIKGASIYNHFKGKEEIFQAIFDEMTKQYMQFADQMTIPNQADASAIERFVQIEEEQLQEMAEGLICFYTQNEFAVMFRRLVVSEQFHFKAAAKCFREYYLEAPVLFQKQLFDGIQKGGGFRQFDPEIMAIHFYSPLYYMLSLFDAGGNMEECRGKIKAHIHTFIQLYCK